ncbi:pyridoxamine 5'-phosphate oxidase family protein [Clostridium estertheticum]|nr:pyridoxamine 5'-phosphate oxidase family protein [Clostridium estertheticum]
MLISFFTTSFAYTSDVFVQILNNPKVGFTVSEPNGKYVIRIVGTAAIITKPS